MYSAKDGALWRIHKCWLACLLLTGQGWLRKSCHPKMTRRVQAQDTRRVNMLWHCYSGGRFLYLRLSRVSLFSVVITEYWSWGMFKKEMSFGSWFWRLGRARSRRHRASHDMRHTHKRQSQIGFDNRPSLKKIHEQINPFLRAEPSWPNHLWKVPLGCSF